MRSKGIRSGVVWRGSVMVVCGAVFVWRKSCVVQVCGEEVCEARFCSVVKP